MRGEIEFRAVGRFAAFNFAAEHPAQRFLLLAAGRLLAFTDALRQACGFIHTIETFAYRVNAAHGSACQGLAGEEQNENKRGDTFRHDVFENTRARFALSTPCVRGRADEAVEDANKTLT